MAGTFDDFRAGIDRCQSPLERELVHAFAGLARFQWRHDNLHRWEVGRWPGWFLTLLAQPQYDQYRVDFGICSWIFDEQDLPPMIVVVEVDGHDFHEKTKEQARRDKARDRFMTETEARVFRFTGSEVYRDATACAAQVLQYVLKHQQKHLEEEFKKFVRANAASLPKKQDT
jgi:very-short-patch-repair endonuclease